jgi:hypothetical protein
MLLRSRIQPAPVEVVSSTVPQQQEAQRGRRGPGSQPTVSYSLAQAQVRARAGTNLEDLGAGTSEGGTLVCGGVRLGGLAPQASSRRTWLACRAVYGKVRKIRKRATSRTQIGRPSSDVPNEKHLASDGRVIAANTGEVQSLQWSS